MGHQQTIEFRVQHDETDQMGVVHHSRYLEYFDLGRLELSRAVGLPGCAAALPEAGRPASPCDSLQLAGVEVRFLAPARFGDTLRLSTAVAEACGSQVVFKSLLKRIMPAPELLIAEATSAAKVLAPDGRERPLVPDELAALGGGPAPASV